MGPFRYGQSLLLLGVFWFLRLGGDQFQRPGDFWGGGRHNVTDGVVSGLVGVVLDLDWCTVVADVGVRTFDHLGSAFGASVLYVSGGLGNDAVFGFVSETPHRWDTLMGVKTKIKTSKPPVGSRHLPVFEVSVEVYFLRLSNDGRQLVVDCLVHRSDGDFGSDWDGRDDRGRGGRREGRDGGNSTWVVTSVVTCVQILRSIYGSGKSKPSVRLDVKITTETNLGIPGSSLGIRSTLGNPGILGSNLGSPGYPGSKRRHGIPGIQCIPDIPGSTPVVRGSKLGWTARIRY